MNIKEKIFSALRESYPQLKQLKDDYYIIGATALILSGIEIENTNDIDIVVSERDAEWLKSEWKNKKINISPDASILFRSNYSRYQFSDIEIEILGSLEVNKDNNWTPLLIKDFTIYEKTGFQVKIPTRIELVRILNFFGRKKDLERLKLIQIN
jgi:hypothetical protein